MAMNNCATATTTLRKQCSIAIRHEILAYILFVYIFSLSQNKNTHSNSHKH